MGTIALVRAMKKQKISLILFPTFVDLFEMHTFVTLIPVLGNTVPRQCDVRSKTNFQLGSFPGVQSCQCRQNFTFAFYQA